MLRPGTADAIARTCHLPIQFEPSLHERKVGDLQGTPVRGEFGVWPDTLARWVAGETGTPRGHRIVRRIRDRVLPVWDRVTLENQGKTIVIVAHGIVVRVLLLSVLEGYNSADWPRLGRIANASISEVVGSGRLWRAVRIGHVPDEVRKAHESEEMRPLVTILARHRPRLSLPVETPQSPPAGARSSDEDAEPARPIPFPVTPLRPNSRSRRRPHDRPRDAVTADGRDGVTPPATPAGPAACSVGALASSVAHEFNNILTTIINYAKLGLEGRGRPGPKQALEKILKGGQRAATISTACSASPATSPPAARTDLVAWSRRC